MCWNYPNKLLQLIGVPRTTGDAECLRNIGIHPVVYYLLLLRTVDLSHVPLPANCSVAATNSTRLGNFTSLKADSHRHARHVKTVLCVSRPLRRWELDSRQLKTVADRKSEVWTRQWRLSNSHRHAAHDRTVLSCLGGGVNWALSYTRPNSSELNPYNGNALAKVN